jgi:hypothetical protein
MINFAILEENVQIKEVLEDLKLHLILITEEKMEIEQYSLFLNKFLPDIIKTMLNRKYSFNI